MEKSGGDHSNKVSRRRFLGTALGAAAGVAAAVIAPEVAQAYGPNNARQTETTSDMITFIEGENKAKFAPRETLALDPKTGELAPIGPMLVEAFRDPDKTRYQHLDSDANAVNARLVEFTDKKNRKGQALVLDVNYNLLASPNRLPYDRAEVNVTGERGGKEWSYGWNLDPKWVDKIYRAQNADSHYSNSGYVSLMLTWGEYAPSQVVQGWSPDKGRYSAFNPFDKPKPDLSNIKAMSLQLVKDGPQPADRKPIFRSTLK